MPTYTVKGKVTCLSRADGAVIASWFKELTVDAATEALALTQAEQLIAQEYDDADVTHRSELQVAGGGSGPQLGPLPPPVAPPPPRAEAPPVVKPFAQPEPPAPDPGKTHRFRI
ncbi:MAG: hypothetical protein SFY70_08755 [Bacteroidia bacterium]|nr:hypothetical protein [Bacteroidia bacterium]